MHKVMYQTPFLKYISTEPSHSFLQWSPTSGETSGQESETVDLDNDWD